ncbi:PREDICTED: malonyl-coenzyme:anthocyanin 5-O-glucoside-6'''-O-malonyltransferase-like [Ipomoea nil]|uniref:malonyl-coenzyme:anthocyanin 5-O-glucoside-6'''-O-malonyltransferase-like n=1 Tax=Ipomoea nil TaxID=35883 RepID=UPI0009015FC7|nr:PREDICTED: malonyl-coenzyme:anthocyanin 5-O-glucoside-6'''-O-malonyltransferase-like [Ipomoea nil]
MDVNQTVTVLEKIPVAPPPEANAGISLPFTFLDVFWLHLDPVHRLIFYRHPISRTHFLDTLIPTIKHSLSLTLQHYSPLAGVVVVSPDKSSLPEIRYADGDTVPLVFAESNSGEAHFNHLTSNYGRSCSEFHPLVPSLPPASREPDGSIRVPVLGLQVTLFPDVGICIGVTNHHAIGDGSTIFAFMKAWAFFSSRENTSPVSLPQEFRPFFDRTVIQDRKGLGTHIWNHMKNIKIEDKHVHRLPSITDKVRATFAVTRDDIQRLKTHVISRRPDLEHVSSFTMITSYVWNCLVKSRIQTSTDNNEDEDGDGDGDGDDYFTCPADYRARFDPPVPRNYFGNCILGFVGKTKRKQLVGEEGFAEAAVVIGESIHSQLDTNKDDVDDDKWAELSKINPDRALSVASSPRFDYYQLDFGWGKPKKFEVPSIDLTGAMSLSTAKDYEGGLEVGLSLPISQINTFSRVFTQGLRAI